MATLFDPLDLGPLHLPNRVIMAPMSRSRADVDGVPTALVAEYYAQRAAAGLIISESNFISDYSRAYPGSAGLISEAHVAGWRTVTDAVHAKGGRIFAQIYHTGRVSLPESIPDGGAPIAPSAIAIPGFKQTADGRKPFAVPRALRTHEIAEAVNQFARAAECAVSADFDGVEIHAASGYLIHQFLDPISNQRDDAYGGSATNRMRFLLEVAEAVSAVVGADRTGVKFAPRIPFNGVIEPDAEYLYPLAARALSAIGIAYLHVAVQKGYAAGELRHHFTGGFLVGTGLDYRTASALVMDGAADATVFGRPFLANPDLVRRFAEGLDLAQADPGTIYGGGERGYTDYPPYA